MTTHRNDDVRVSVHVKLPPSIARVLTKVARENGMGRSQYVRSLVTIHLNKLHVKAEETAE